MRTDVLVTTGNQFEGYGISEYPGIVRGIVVRAQTISQGIRGSFARILGGNIRAYEEVCEHARAEAYARMVQHAEEEGATPSSPCAMTPPSSARASRKCWLTAPRSNLCGRSSSHHVVRNPWESEGSTAVRFPEDKIKEAILHPDPEIRDRATEYFAESFSQTPPSCRWSSRPSRHTARMTPTD